MISSSKLDPDRITAYILRYFDEFFVEKKPIRDRRRRLPPYYIPTLWNQCNLILMHTARINISEGFQNQLQITIGIILAYTNFKWN